MTTACRRIRHRSSSRGRYPCSACDIRSLALIVCGFAALAMPPRHRRRRRRPGRSDRSSSSFRSGPAPASTSPRGCSPTSCRRNGASRWWSKTGPGGDAFVAITAVISANDDHVLLFAPASTFTAHPLLHDKLPYNINDLVPIARVTNTLIGARRADLARASTRVKELAAKIKADAGQAELRLGDRRQRSAVRRLPEDRKARHGEGAVQGPGAGHQRSRRRAHPRLRRRLRDPAAAGADRQGQGARADQLASTRRRCRISRPRQEAGFKSLDLGRPGRPARAAATCRWRCASASPPISARSSPIRRSPRGSRDRAGGQSGLAGRIRRRARRSARHRGGIGKTLGIKAAQ